jgi:hypothetical protein
VMRPRAGRWSDSSDSFGHPLMFGNGASIAIYDGLNSRTPFDGYDHYNIHLAYC